MISTTDAAIPAVVKDKPIDLLQLDKLLLDEINPRFANYDEPSSTQRDILNLIVKQFGIDDVLSSISVSGYFSAEPLVCRKTSDDKYTVVEGNRRLAACLILAGDERAIDQAGKQQKYQLLHSEHGSPEFMPVPAIVFGESESQEQLLSYLGVRHIVSTKEWDSFAKAAWVSHALETSNLNLDDIARMIGDTRGTIRHLLRGYNFVKQLQDTGHFDPSNSVKKGRGSNTLYPFSWVYTVLSFNSIQEFIKISADPQSNSPIPTDKIDDAALIVRAMFGDTSKSTNPAITDSRQITQLAQVVADPEKVVYLKQGKSVDEINRLTQPLADLLGVALVDIQEKLRESNFRIEGEPENLEPSEAEKLIKMSSTIVRLSKALNIKIRDIANPDNTD